MIEKKASNYRLYIYKPIN